MSKDFQDFQPEMDAILADPARRARVEEYGRQIDVILALSALREALGMTQAVRRCRRYEPGERVAHRARDGCEDVNDPKACGQRWCAG